MKLDLVLLSGSLSHWVSLCIHLPSSCLDITTVSVLIYFSFISCILAESVSPFLSSTSFSFPRFLR